MATIVGAPSEKSTASEYEGRRAMKELKAAAGEASNLLKSLANPLRLQVLCELAAGGR